MQSSANLNNADPVSPVVAAARAEKWRTVWRLVELKADPDLVSRSPSASTETSQTTMIANGNMKSEGVENMEAASIAPVLILAVTAGEQDLVEFLCSNGASPNLMDDTSSAVGSAAATNHLGIIKLLAEARADLD